MNMNLVDMNQEIESAFCDQGNLHVVHWTKLMAQQGRRRRELDRSALAEKVRKEQNWKESQILIVESISRGTIQIAEQPWKQKKKLKMKRLNGIRIHDTAWYVRMNIDKNAMVFVEYSVSGMFVWLWSLKSVNKHEDTARMQAKNNH